MTTAERFEQLVSRGMELLNTADLEPPAAAVGWAAVCLDFLARVFTKDSAHWELWHAVYGDTAKDRKVLTRCVAHLREAAKDYNARQIEEAPSRPR